MTALDYFRQFAPEFNTLSDDIVNGWLASAVVFVPNPDASEKSKLSQALYAAHLCWFMKYQRGGYRGVITTEGAADGSRRSYAAPKGSELVLGQSPYGLQYMQLNGMAQHRPAIMTRFG